MALLATSTLDDKIREAATEAYHCADVAIERCTVSERGAALDAGVWFALFIKPSLDSG
jgi:hypothetical protein